MSSSSDSENSKPSFLFLDEVSSKLVATNSVTDTAEYQVPLSARSYSSVHIGANPGRP